MPWQEKDKRDLHGEKRKREICMAREVKEKFAWQEKEKRDLHGKRRKRDISIARDGKER